MKKWKILPGMAIKGITSNGTIYYPYLAAGIFAVFIYFVFSSILYNDLMRTLPRSAYAWVLLEIGKWLLGVILFFFLIYANSFLIKRRKKEMGLYSLLGMEKKHIAMMLFLETVILYGVVTTGGIISGVLLSKFFFLLLLRLSSLPVDVEFVFDLNAFQETLIYFIVVFLLNYVKQIWELRKARPVELLSGNKKGEKEPGLLWLWTIIGILAMGTGYSLAIRAKIDSSIFTNFFLAVFFVIIGTYLLFTSGSVIFLKLLRRNKRTYYQPANFITISGMYYRMKKNASSLSNICIFSTMVIITLICTVSLYLGIEEITHYSYPYDITADFQKGSLGQDELENKMAELETKYELTVLRKDIYNFKDFYCSKEENKFEPAGHTGFFVDDEKVTVITLEDYNRLTGENEVLADNEVMIYSEGTNFEFNTVEFMGILSNIKKEAKELFPYPKAGKDAFDARYVIVVKNQEAYDAYIIAYAECVGVDDMEAFFNSSSLKIGILMDGKEEEKQDFTEEILIWCQGHPGYTSHRDGLEGRADLRSMYGGLLFVGVVFGLIFFLFLIIIMYYKQISEGYEDQGSFDIMQKVGMSDGEIRSTIHRQILLVFVLPLFWALMHTVVGMFMVDRLMAAISFFDTRLMLVCTVGISACFVLIYGVSYVTTSKAYYRIVRNYATPFTCLNFHLPR